VGRHPLPCAQRTPTELGPRPGAQVYAAEAAALQTKHNIAHDHDDGDDAPPGKKAKRPKKGSLKVGRPRQLPWRRRMLAACLQAT
jgi:hypothetical protein